MRRGCSSGCSNLPSRLPPRQLPRASSATAHAEVRSGRLKQVTQIHAGGRGNGLGDVTLVRARGIARGGVQAADPYTCRKLQLRDGEQVLFVKRLRGTSEFFPVVLFNSQIPMSFGIRPDEDLGGSLYHLLEQQHGIPIQWAEEEIRAGKASDEEAQLLRLRRGESVLVMERVTFTRSNRPLEFVRGVYRPEHYKYSIRLRR